MTKKTAIAVGLAALVSGCVPHETPPPMTQLEIRVAQTREFETNDVKLVMKTMMHVLQDEGYIIKNAVLDLGLLSAEKQVNVEDRGEALLAQMVAGQQARWMKQKVMEASANVSEFGSRTRVRVNFQIKTYDNVGCVKDIIDVKEPEIYQEFFNKVHKAIFLQQEGI